MNLTVFALAALILSSAACSSVGHARASTSGANFHLPADRTGALENSNGQESSSNRYESTRVGASVGLSLYDKTEGLSYKGETPFNIEIGKRLTPVYEVGLLYNSIQGTLHDSFGDFDADQFAVALNNRFYLQEWGASEPWLQLAAGQARIEYSGNSFFGVPSDDSGVYIRGGFGTSIPLTEQLLFEPSLSGSMVTDTKSQSNPIDWSIQIGFSYAF